MAKKLLFFSIFTCFQVLAFAFRTDGFKPQPSANRSGDYCDAPAPDNFSVTGMASDLVTLGWDPAMPGAMHTLELLVEENGAWKSLWINPEVPGDAIVLDNLEPGNYLARLATNCETGETGEEFTDLPIRFKIIDLVIVGRMPKNPQVVENCQQIDYLNHKWTGFSVTEIATGLTNYFEFVWNGEGSPKIKRVIRDHPIVAVNFNGNYPISPDDIIKANSPFGINHLLESGNAGIINIGGIDCWSSTPDHIGICKNENGNPVPWKPEYRFEALVAEGILDSYPTSTNPSNENSLNIMYPNNGTWSTKNSFQDYIEVFYNGPKSDQDKVLFSLFDVQGVLQLQFFTVANQGSYYLPTAAILPGNYVLRISDQNGSKSFRMIK